MLFTSAWMHLHRWQVRSQLKQYTLATSDDSRLVWIKLSSHSARKDLRWKNKTEFEYRGVLYDLVSLHHTGDSLYMRCWPDLLETGLGHHLDRLLGNLPFSPTRQQHLHALFDFLKLLPGPAKPNQPAGIAHSGFSSFFFAKALQSILIATPPDPPPERLA